MIKFNIKLQRMIHNNMSQKTLGKLTGIRLATLSEYENSKATTVRVEHLEKLCEVFDCQLSDIIYYCPNDDKCQFCYSRVPEKKDHSAEDTE